MRVDWFIADLGLARSDDDDLPEEVASLISDEAEGFLRAFGALSWAEWRGLHPETRRAFADAGDKIRREQAAYTGAATVSSTISEALLKGRDLDDASAAAYLDVLVPAIEQRMQMTRDPE